MASLRPQLPIQQTNHIERPTGSCIALSGEDLDPRVGRDVCLELVEETSPLELSNGHSINLGTGLNSDECAIITPILISNIDLFAWSAADLPGVDCNIPKEYYLKINNKRNNYINSHLDKNPNEGKINFMNARAKTYNKISQLLQVSIIRVRNKNIK